MEPLTEEDIKGILSAITEETIKEQIEKESWFAIDPVNKGKNIRKPYLVLFLQMKNKGVLEETVELPGSSTEDIAAGVQEARKLAIEKAIASLKQDTLYKIQSGLY